MQGSNGGLSTIIYADIAGIENYASSFGISLTLKGIVGLITPLCAGSFLFNKTFKLQFTSTFK